MALQLGALRGALISAGVDKPQASAAAEDVAGYEHRLTRLSTQMQFVIAVMLLLLGSQAALWAEYGKLGSQISELQARTTRIEEQNSKMAEQTAKLTEQTAKVLEQNAQIISQLARITSPPR